MLRRAPVLVLAVAVAVACGLVASLAIRSTAGEAGISSATRAAGGRYEPAVTPADRAWIRAAIGQIRPEARRLVDEVDGMVTFHTEPGGEMMGLAESGPEGSRVWFNVARLDGDRMQDRATAVAHELGHVIDYELVEDDLMRRLDAGIPRGGPCVQDGSGNGVGGGCTPVEERFADTFAKWALRGRVSAAGSGYMIPSPASLEDWGAPLAELALSLPR
jgi:hypothetical protein